MVQKLVDDIRAALNHDLYYVALSTVLTLPDICGKAEYPNEKSSKKRYIDWYDKEIGKYEKNPHQTASEEMPYLSGSVIYSLRCSLLHEGNPNIDNDCLTKKNESLPIDHFILKVESKNDFDIYSDGSGISDMLGQQAITAFLEGTDFEDVVRCAVSLGGDYDTLTCIAAGIAEAFYGVRKTTRKRHYLGLN